MIFETCRLDVQPACTAAAAYGHEHGVVYAILPVAHEDAHLAGWRLLKSRGYHPSLEFDTLLFHEASDHFGDILIEATEQNRSDHHGGVEAEACNEASTLQGDVRGAHYECLARRLGLPEDIVRAD